MVAHRHTNLFVTAQQKITVWSNRSHATYCSLRGFVHFWLWIFYAGTDKKDLCPGLSTATTAERHCQADNPGLCDMACKIVPCPPTERNFLSQCFKNTRATNFDNHGKEVPRDTVTARGTFHDFLQSSCWLAGLVSQWYFCKQVWQSPLLARNNYLYHRGMCCLFGRCWVPATFLPFLVFVWIAWTKDSLLWPRELWVDPLDGFVFTLASSDQSLLITYEYLMNNYRFPCMVVVYFNHTVNCQIVSLGRGNTN